MKPTKTISEVDSIFLMEGDTRTAGLTHGFTGLILRMGDGRIVLHGTTDPMQAFTEIKPDHREYEQLRLLIEPTPPTQEKELLKCSRDEKMMICYCGKCEPGSYSLPRDFKVMGIDFGFTKEKPTQDTESWMEDKDFQRILGYLKEGEANYIISFIKQKKQEWQRVGTKRYHPLAISLLKAARTQGAEAAVEYMGKALLSSDPDDDDDDDWLELRVKSFRKVLEEAKKV